MRYWNLIVILTALFIVTGCSPAAVDPTDDALTEEPLTEEPTVEVTEQASATPTTDPTATPTPTPTFEPGIIPTLDRYQSHADDCPFLPSGAGEAVMGTLTQPAWMEPVYSDYDPRYIVGCYYLAEANEMWLRVWGADSKAAAEEAFALWDEYSVPVEGLGDEAVWWPHLLRLEVRHHNMLLWITFSRPIDDAANAAARLASLSLPLIDPTLGTITPPQVTVPADAPTLEYLRDLSQEPEFFDACSLASVAEFEALVGPVNGQLVGGFSPSKTVGQFYDCYVLMDTTAVSHSISVSRPASALEMFLFLQELRDLEEGWVTLPLEIGEHSKLWQQHDTNYYALIVRGNAMIRMIFKLEPSPENEQRVRDFITLIMDRLIERYGE